ncbi:putative glutamate-5-semialdehyde dehydrogenase, Glutamate 5-kinase [Helianthus annuus]|uniref:Delta-1-pyrroline-5-carboxylate synthase n=1 Tax=Helianthus annuus TaxID=4232 RepID=A0A251UI44_HELAN|nr:delta-1-pyrroline-5-carboxylate synthase [Helianthus annuus]KAF5802349.1 putative glutamate-5-semialdehyde dehydrogenase, Glutamate 5-kinase [Helianthus annuus]KAJ0560495.1 putative glutamate-5-semialdehyde dehydrogenase, Glutamate 5-kinase [Helianthus annuus]KAJ0566852.1 putative glutamate-5-semialdehyde dehydrogenase, Glutamate 5-kinase [Helianthus annuus]KAJ0573524.1 putative glutamate-5-semialdehyde dehydrogenase, Glutamate 5-kinase [Helianthus annuus]KAJ0737887.1 putative glutamate-5-s
MDPTRAFVKNVKRVVVKVGTAVVTRDDGRLAVGRLGAIFEQLEKLNSRGFEIILVTSGAVGAGRQRLKYRKMINSSFADLQKPQGELDGKACAAVGQNGLMALYDTLFSQLDVTSSQLLVTDNDFKNEDFREQLCQTVDSLLDLRSIPIFNENDAISTRRAPYEDSSGIFWDNDSLAALLAMELKADLLVLLSDVNGLYSGPPTDPRSKLIHTYVKQKHQKTISFGDKSRMGRGGMDAKVKAASNAAYSGTPVVIASGFAPNNIIKVLNGERVGTLFHKDAHMWIPVTEIGPHEMAVSAREASRRLQGLTSEERKKILLDVAAALEANEQFIVLENDADVEAARDAGYDEALVARLALKPSKIRALAESVRRLAKMEEPIGQVLKRTELAEGLVLEKKSCPLGVLLIVFESRPDALVQIASLAIRSGNGLLLKGGKEAKRSNAILHKVITSALPETVGTKLIGLLTSREEIPELLKLDDVIDLVIPRGSNKLVSQIKSSTKIPVLGHSDGICHVYVDKAANLEMAKKIVLDAKTDYPAACNAMETLLIHKDLLASGGLQELVKELEKEGVTLFSGPRVNGVVSFSKANTFHHEYNSKACTIEIVNNVDEAIEHIHSYGSSHTECIVTDNRDVAEHFLSRVDSAAVFHNASTRFCDGARFGLGAEVGISTSKIHARGPVGVEGLLTTRWVLRGKGQVVEGDKGVVYTHKELLTSNGY